MPRGHPAAVDAAPGRPAAARGDAPPEPPPMYIPAPSATDAATSPGAADSPPATPPPPLQLFGRDGLVSADAPQAPPEPGSAGGGNAGSNPLLPLLVVAGLALAVHGLLLLVASERLADTGSTRLLLTLQWLAGSLLVLPVGLCLHRLTGRVTPAVAAAVIVAMHPGVLTATVVPGGVFWALAAAAAAVFLLFGGEREPRDGSRPVPGVAASAAAGFVLGAGGLVALPAAALALPLGLWRVLYGLGCPGPGRGPRDVVAGVVLVAAAAIPIASFHAVDGDSAADRLLAAPHGEWVPRLIESRWPTLLGRLGLAPGLDLAAELDSALAGPPPMSEDLLAPAPAPAAPASVDPEPAGFDRAAGLAWTGLNALLLAGSAVGAGLALHRRRRALGLLLLLAVPAALVADGASGEGARLALLPLQLLLLGVWWLPSGGFRQPSAAFRVPVADAGFTISQNTPRVI